MRRNGKESDRADGMGLYSSRKLMATASGAQTEDPICSDLASFTGATSETTRVMEPLTTIHAGLV
jgi:hypothetical protein